MLKIVYAYETIITIKMQNIYIILKQFLFFFSVHPFTFQT